MAGVERRLASILAADAVGYSRLMGVNETTTHTRLRQLQAGTVDPLAAQHHGRVVKLTGDGALMEFRSVVDAVHCAIAVQNAVAEREAESPQDQRIQFRIGINLGDVIVDGEDVYGDAVNIASRLEGLAEPSGIVVSDNAMQFLDEALRARFVDGGRHDLKNIERPIRIWRWLAQFDVRAQRKRLERPSVAVLPFDSLGPEPDQGYFADGITEDIITELARFRSLLVIDRKSSFAYRHRYVPASAAGRELGVHFVLSGSVRHIGNRLRINALLVSAATDEQVWGQRYDRLLTGIFEVQDGLVQSIIGAMTGRLEDAVARLARRKPPESMGAYDLVLRGNELLHRHNRGDDLNARELFQRAVEIDPDYVLAHVRLAQTYLNEFFWDDSGALLGRAFEIARQAIEIDDSESWSHMVLAIAYLHQRDFERTLHHLRRSLELNPNDAATAAKAGLLFADLGQPEDAIEWIERARRLDPYRKDSYADYLGLALFCAQRYQEAIKAFEVTSDPKFYDHVWLAASYAHMGDLDEAREHGRRVLELAPNFTIGRFQRLEPYKSKADLERWVTGLRKAGLPA